MELLLTILFGWILLHSTHGWNTKRNKEILTFSHALCQHGERNLVTSFPDDEWFRKDFWPEGFGQLSNFGKNQHFRLGRDLRKRYYKLIGIDGYLRNKVLIQSSDVDQVLMSGHVTAAGMFPPNPFQIWNPKLNWQPIPIHTLPITKDSSLALKRPCDRFHYLMIKEYEETPAYTDLFEQNRALIRYLEEYSGQNLSSINSIHVLYQALDAEKSKGYCLPDWAEQVMTRGSDFHKLALKWHEIYTVTPEMKKFRSGFLLKEIFDRSRSKVQKTLSPDRSLWLYFAHDFTLSGMLNSLGLFRPHTPPYASCLLFELYESVSGPFLQIVYKNSTKRNIPALEIPNCGTKCPLDRMYELYDEILPKQSYDDECTLRGGETIPPNGNPEDFSLYG